MGPYSGLRAVGGELDAVPMTPHDGGYFSYACTHTEGT